MRYAINLYDWFGDLKEKSLTPQGLLLRNVLDLNNPETVECEGERIDGGSFLAGADVSTEKWEAIVTLLRDKFGRPRYKYRLYQSKTGKGSWKRV